MNYLSVCSGIEAATTAWHSLGWSPVGFSEIERFPSAVLAHHYPDVPNLGDMTRYREWDLGCACVQNRAERGCGGIVRDGGSRPDTASSEQRVNGSTVNRYSTGGHCARCRRPNVDLLVGGTPCQSFSVAGLRAGLDDPRGNLALTFLGIVDRFRPRWVVWENVPGVLSSSGGRDFGAFLGGLGQLGYGWAYRVLDAQYVRVDSHPRAVPQRRRRVFVVGCAGGDWHRAAAVLFERESLSGNPAPRREAGKGAAGSPARCVADGRGVMGFSGQNLGCDPSVAYTLNTGASHQNRGLHVAHALRAEGFDAGEDGTGPGTPIAPIVFDPTQITSRTNRSNPQPGDPCHTLARGMAAPVVAFDWKMGDRARSVAFSEEHSPTLGAQSDRYAVQDRNAVRRLTPTECERLQGFPDGYTQVPYRGKPAADGPRYKALGNSMAVNVMRWIGQRIQMVNSYTADRVTSEKT